LTIFQKLVAINTISFWDDRWECYIIKMETTPLILIDKQLGWQVAQGHPQSSLGIVHKGKDFSGGSELSASEPAPTWYYTFVLHLLKRLVLLKQLHSCAVLKIYDEVWHCVARLDHDTGFHLLKGHMIQYLKKKRHSQLSTNSRANRQAVGTPNENKKTF
jgi:hypothetical protein